MSRALKQIKSILAGDENDRYGVVAGISSGYLKIKTSTGLVRVPYVAGYVAGDRVILTASNVIKGRSPNSKKIPIHPV